MGGSVGEKSSKSEKSSTFAPPTEQSNVHVYSEWAAVQAYYGPGVAMPPYYNQAVAPGHLPPPYIWGPQPMMSPYGTPYAAIYAPGGVYAHPAVPLGTPPHGQGVSTPAVSKPPVATLLSINTPAKLPGNADKGLMKKLKGFDGLAMSVGNGNGNGNGNGKSNANANVEASAENKLSHSAETDGSSNGSEGSTEQPIENTRKRCREESLCDREDEQVESKPPRPATDKVLAIPITAANAAAGHVMGTVAPPSVSTALELLNPEIDVKGNSTTVSSSNTAMSSGVWIQNERELKRERRKQSNRESARRSRLRKQAEAEELGRKVDSLSTENTALKSEINELVENSKKLRLENAALLDKLKSLQTEEKENTFDVKLNPADSTENLLSRVNNSGPVSRTSEEGTNMYEKSSKSKGAKFRQLLRADAVACWLNNKEETYKSL